MMMLEEKASCWRKTSNIRGVMLEELLKNLQHPPTCQVSNNKYLRSMLEEYIYTPPLENKASGRGGGGKFFSVLWLGPI